MMEKRFICVADEIRAKIDAIRKAPYTSKNLMEKILVEKLDEALKEKKKCG